MKLEVIFWLFKECKNDPNDALNLFSCFYNLEKYKLCLCGLHLMLSYIKMIRILVNIMMKYEKLTIYSEGTTHK